MKILRLIYEAEEVPSFSADAEHRPVRNLRWLADVSWLLRNRYVGHHESPDLHQYGGRKIVLLDPMATAQDSRQARNVNDLVGDLERSAADRNETVESRVYVAKLSPAETA